MPQQLPTLWSQIPNTAIVSDTSNVPEHDFATVTILGSRAIFRVDNHRDYNLSASRALV